MKANLLILASLVLSTNLFARTHEQVKILKETRSILQTRKLSESIVLNAVKVFRDIDITSPEELKKLNSEARAESKKLPKLKRGMAEDLAVKVARSQFPRENNQAYHAGIKMGWMVNPPMDCNVVGASAHAVIAVGIGASVHLGTCNSYDERTYAIIIPSVYYDRGFGVFAMLESTEFTIEDGKILFAHEDEGIFSGLGIAIDGPFESGSSTNAIGVGLGVIAFKGLGLKLFLVPVKDEMKNFQLLH